MTLKLRRPLYFPLSKCGLLLYCIAQSVLCCGRRYWHFARAIKLCFACKQPLHSLLFPELHCVLERPGTLEWAAKMRCCPPPDA